MDGIRKRIHFLKTAILDPHVGGITMSSQYVVEHVLKHLPKGLDMVIECGPGEGVLTKELLKNLSLSGKLLTVEANHDFVQRLLKISDNRLEVMHGTAQMALSDLGIEQGTVDLVISSIPFSFLTRVERLKMIHDIHDVLKPGGTFIIFNQYRQVMHAPIKKLFETVSIAFELRNIPPCFIVHAIKAK